MEYIEIGKAVNTHGLKGELKIESWSDFDEIRYEAGNTVYIEYKDELIPMKVKTYRSHKGFALVSFEDYQDINLVEKFKGCILLVNAEDRPDLEEGEYYFDELIGFRAVDEEGNPIGEVIDVEETAGAQNNLRVRRDDGTTVLIPNVPAFVTEINDEEGIITVHVIEGLL
ncbi:MAG: ribosome maturation factor RimM [Solobacterium sp.]|nr:ribosome maturation factor RimM [Solobacterium sp.]